MSGGPLPPLPDLIPISALRRSPSVGEGAHNPEEVMGEQRSRRRAGNQPAAVELIDSAAAGSRGASAAPRAPQSRKAARSERHRKSDRRRGQRRSERTCPEAKQQQQQQRCTRSSRATQPRRFATSPERPTNPRVNPIFVWVRQEDARIVDVKCEDYDKRNRILLTKTAQGWRAIPRTETLVPGLKGAANEDQEQQHQHHHHQHHHHHHRNKKSRKSKVRRRSTGVQVDSDIGQDTEADHEHNADEDVDQPPVQQPWMTADNVNVESLLPSHTIQVKRPSSPSPERCSQTDVNSAEESAPTPTECSAGGEKISDVSPLDNLLAAAELEFNEQIRTGEWDKSENAVIGGEEQSEQADFSKEVEEEEDAEHKEFIKNLEQLNDLIESEENKLEECDSFEEETEQKSEHECDYNEEDDNNLAMDDILSRLEQSLRSPEGGEGNNSDAIKNKEVNEGVKQVNNYTSDNESYKSVPDEFQNYYEQMDEVKEESKDKDIHKEEPEKPEIIDLVESSTNDDDEPTDLSIKPHTEISENACDVSEALEEPTDLSIPKITPIRLLTPRPSSQNSEAIQSPQPSGIPAVPQSPDTVSTTSSKTKPIFLESLLNTSSKKISLNSEVTITRQKEPLDLGKCRKSASPTVTCSEEINASVQENEPPAKKFKSIDITLKNLLDADLQKDTKTNDKAVQKETPRLLELLKTDAEPDPLTQLKQLLSDQTFSIPDPMLVPKDKFSLILTRPGIEIPKLLKERPELRLPEALAFPHIMQDPNMLVLNIQHLESILSNKIAHGLEPNPAPKVTEKPVKKVDKPSNDFKETKRKPEPKGNSHSEPQGKNFNELASDIDAATQAAFSQMVWLPYLNHLEAMSAGNNTDIMKMLSSSLQSFPFYQNQVPDISPMFANRFPSLGFPLQTPMNYTNPTELNMWQEAMLQAQMLKNKSFESLNATKPPFREYPNVSQPKKISSSHHQRSHAASKQQSYQNNFYSTSVPNSHLPSAYQNPYMNLNAFQTNSLNSNLQLPQYNPLPHQKNQIIQKPNSSQSYMQKHIANMQMQKMDSNHNFNIIYSQLSEQEKHQYLQGLGSQELQHHHQQTNSRKPKVNCKAFAGVSHTSMQKQAHHEHHQKEKSQPIDLSGSTAPQVSKLKVKQHLVDAANAAKLLKHHDDVPEVGSTTASIEEMQDAHKHLWHPLFGNQKGYTSPWNWTTVTATGE